MDAYDQLWELFDREVQQANGIEGVTRYFAWLTHNAQRPDVQEPFQQVRAGDEVLEAFLYGLGFRKAPR
jgi:hypothetical protein